MDTNDSILNFFKHIILHVYRIRDQGFIERKLSNGSLNPNSNTTSNDIKFKRHSSLSHRSSSSSLDEDDDKQLHDQILIFNVEEAVLRCTSLFSFFMLVALEAGSPTRALVLLAFYPFMCLVGKDIGLRIMAFICFIGIKRDGFQKVGRVVLPKVFLDDVGSEGFEVIRKFRIKIGVTHLPRVMVEYFLRDYLGIDHVVGREMKEFHGFFNGLMKDKDVKDGVKEIVGEKNYVHGNVVGVCGSRSSLQHPLLSSCKEIYLTSRKERSKWSTLSRTEYTKPLIFHDSRLSVKPTPLTTLALFMWVPFAVILMALRALTIKFFPTKLQRPILFFSGIRIMFSKSKSGSQETMSSQQPLKHSKRKGVLFVSNHRTLSDPVCLNIMLDQNVTAVTYSLSRISEILSPIRTVRLTRQRNNDAVMMERVLSQGNLVVCPEGTTCREPYLLRFSPLFAEMSDEIVPVAMNTQFSFFYGNTAGGKKYLDPFFFLMDPHPSYTIKLLDKVDGLSLCWTNGERSNIKVANYIQGEIGRALGFTCTKLTRKDKYLILADNAGISKQYNK